MRLRLRQLSFFIIPPFCGPKQKVRCNDKRRADGEVGPPLFLPRASPDKWLDAPRDHKTRNPNVENLNKSKALNPNVQNPNDANVSFSV